MENTHSIKETAEFIIELSDERRKKWFDNVIQNLKNEGIDIVNEDFNSNVSVGLKAKDMPETFPFNEVSGKTVEATVIGFQFLTLASFFKSAAYLTDDKYRELILTMNKNDRWFFAGVGAFFTPFSLLNQHANDVPVVVYNYITNKKAEIETVEKIASEDKMMNMGFLWQMTRICGDAPFSDPDRIIEIKKKLIEMGHDSDWLYDISDPKRKKQ